MKNSTLPTPFETVMVTYDKTDQNGNKTRVTKRGFYSNLFNNFAIPNDWQMFNGALLPHGFGGDHVATDKVIQWDAIPETTK